MHNSYQISQVVLTVKMDVVLIWFLVISYYIPSTTFTAMELYDSEHLFMIIAYQLKYLTRKAGWVWSWIIFLQLVS